jgi:signal transduction histidine kinase
MDLSFAEVVIVAMNALAALGITYLIITICSASILYFSFNGKIDASGKYFFLAELTIIPGIVGVVLGNLNPIFANPPIFFAINIFVWASHVCVLFSVYELTHNINNKKFVVAILCSILYASIIEALRFGNAPIQITTMVASISDACFSFWTYAICKKTQNDELKKNLFFSWIKNIELMLGLFALIRFISCFTADTPINARFPTPTIITFYILFLILNIFRYISYQSLRISWVDSRTLSINPLNRNLVVVTQEKNSLLQGLIASNRVIGIGALASSLAHQLSQPLTGIGLQVETLRRNLSKSGNNHDAVSVLDKVNSQLSKLSNLVKNLRQLFNANSLDFHAVDVAATTNELLEIIEPTLEARKIQLVKYITKNALIMGDAIQIQHILITLLNNSIDAINAANPLSREIKLTIDIEDPYVAIKIEDSGSGIDPKLLPSIFELFKTTKKEGLGVGLWLSQTIILKHQGFITAANSPSGGALFTIQIPRLPIANEKS